MPTEIWGSQLRSGSAHWDLKLAVEGGVEDEEEEEEQEEEEEEEEVVGNKCSVCVC